MAWEKQEHVGPPRPRPRPPRPSIAPNYDDELSEARLALTGVVCCVAVFVGCGFRRVPDQKTLQGIVREMAGADGHRAKWGEGVGGRVRDVRGRR